MKYLLYILKHKKGINYYIIEKEDSEEAIQRAVDNFNWLLKFRLSTVRQGEVIIGVEADKKRKSGSLWKGRVLEPVIVREVDLNKIEKELEEELGKEWLENRRHLL